jgi:hypothetical protein
MIGHHKFKLPQREEKSRSYYRQIDHNANPTGELKDPESFRRGGANLFVLHCIETRFRGRF